MKITPAQPPMPTADASALTGPPISQGPSSNESLFSSVVKGLSSYDRSWKSGERALEKEIAAAPAENRPLLQLQLKMNQVHLSTELASRLADGVSSTVRRLSQING